MRRIDHRRRRQGVSLLELLIVITIIAIMLSLLFPAINLVREASLRTACDENIRQLSLALGQYSEIHRGYLPFPASNDRPGGWALEVLPFMEESALRDRFNTNHPLTSPQNLSAAGKRPALFVCPVILEPKSSIKGIPITSYLLIVEKHQRTDFRRNRSWVLQHCPEESPYPWATSPEITFEDRNYPPSHDSAFGF